MSTSLSGVSGEDELAAPAELTGSLSALFARLHAVLAGRISTGPAFRARLAGQDVELEVDAPAGPRRVTGRVSGHLILAHRFWSAAAPDATSPLYLPTLISEAVLIHRLLSRTDADLGVPAWTSAEEYRKDYRVPAS